MDGNLTFIVAIIGIISALAYSFKGSLFSKFKLKKENEIHDLKQDQVKKEIETTQDKIKEKETHIKELEKKQEQAKEIIKEIAKQNNEEVQKILKEEKISNLIKEFDKW